MASGEERFCWICLDGNVQDKEPLSRPCACPRDVHISCLSRWCLQQAGRSEERNCRFCGHILPDWRSTCIPGLPYPTDCNTSSLQHTEPVIVVKLGDQIHRVRVQPGEEGKRAFQAEIKHLFGIPEETQFEVTFRCKVPSSVEQDQVQLEGLQSYEAATHCAALMASQRQAAEAALQHQLQRLIMKEGHDGPGVQLLQQQLQLCSLHAPAEQGTPLARSPVQQQVQQVQQTMMGALQRQMHQQYGQYHTATQQQQQQYLHYEQPCTPLPHTRHAQSMATSPQQVPSMPHPHLLEPASTSMQQHTSHDQQRHSQHASNHTPWLQRAAFPAGFDSGYVEATPTPKPQAPAGLRCGFDAVNQQGFVGERAGSGLRRSARLRAAQALLGQ